LTHQNVCNALSTCTDGTCSVLAGLGEACADNCGLGMTCADGSCVSGP
jgi:hypothetical protein